MVYHVFHLIKHSINISGLFLVPLGFGRTGACGAVGLAAMQLGALMGHKAWGSGLVKRTQSWIWRCLELCDTAI